MCQGFLHPGHTPNDVSSLADTACEGLQGFPCLTDFLRSFWLGPNIIGIVWKPVRDVGHDGNHGLTLIDRHSSQQTVAQVSREWCTASVARTCRPGRLTAAVAARCMKLRDKAMSIESSDLGM